MNNRSVIGALTLLAALSGAAHAEQLTLNSGARVSAAVSNTDPNYIRVSDDRVISIQATQGVLTSRSPTPDGAVVFSTVSEKPFTLFVQTESGFAFSLQATPGKRAGMSLTVDNSEVRGGEEAREYENKQDSYSALVSGLVSRTWWKLFSLVSKWHCDVVIVDRATFEVVAAVELDDRSHLTADLWLS